MNMQLKEEYPVIISASRRTDLPAFHMDWFINKYKQGDMIWQNPFNPKQQKKICFDQTRLIVFWSKNPESLLKHISFFKNRSLNYYVLYTLNNYPVMFEPSLPSLNMRIDLFKKLTDSIGKGKVIWRYDPILLTEEIDTEYHYKTISQTADSLNGYVQRVIVSFLQYYPKVKKRLQKKNIKFTCPDRNKKKRILKEIKALLSPYNIEIMTCAEELNANQELEPLGILKGRCIDPLLLKKYFSSDETLMQYIYNIKEDKGQREHCGCIKSIDIGRYNSCSFKCLYCYAN